jgi:hypothetical protein
MRRSSAATGLFKHMDMDLPELERRFWLDGADFYHQHLAGDVLMVFPGAGVLNRSEAIGGVEAAPRWTHVELLDPRIMEVRPGTRMLCYRARARRQAGSEYSVPASSLYVRQGGEWKLAFHQQTLSD